MICEKHKQIMTFTRLPGNDFYSESCSICLDNQFVQVRKSDFDYMISQMRVSNSDLIKKINILIDKYLGKEG